MRRLAWFLRNLRTFRLVAIPEQGVHVFVVTEDDVRGVLMEGPGAESLRSLVDEWHNLNPEHHHAELAR